MLIEEGINTIDFAECASSRKAIVECGHLYTGRPFDEGQNFGVAIGLLICESLRDCGFEVEKQWFVDDFHGTEKTYSDEALQELISWGYEPDVIISEAKQTGLAVLLHSLLYLKGRLKPQQREFPPYLGGVPLIYNHQDNETNPSCELIDASLYIEKLGFHHKNLCVTVLPDFYKEQQEKVKQILEAYGLYKPPIITVYFDIESGEIMEIDRWYKQDNE